MARGDPPRRFEDLNQYFLGSRFAVAAFYERAKADPELAAQMRNHMHIVGGYIDAVKQTHKLRQAAATDDPAKP
ncbi:MAG: hypothetical protein NVSMB17_10150 [Candidatus Dormibacteria bacterium]